MRPGRGFGELGHVCGDLGGRCEGFLLGERRGKPPCCHSWRLCNARMRNLAHWIDLSRRNCAVPNEEIPIDFTVGVGVCARSVVSIQIKNIFCRDSVAALSNRHDKEEGLLHMIGMES